MIHVESSITVNRSTKEVFELVSDPSNHARWHGYVTSVQTGAEGPVSVGGRCTWMLRTPIGKGVPMEVEVVEVEPRRRVQFRGTSGPMRVLVTYLFQQETDRTKVQRIADVECAATVAEPLLRGMIRRRNTTDLRALKGYLEADEAEQDTPPPTT
ncbi:MAG: SRPBCC family protein [Actinomycetota bacterium]|nr:SRPBCC family protein [Actinomycetota bacterium]